MSNDTQHFEFCKEVRRRRLSMGMTLEQLAERSGLTPNYIGAVELGKRDPSLSTIISLANGFGVTPGELLGPVPGLSPAGLEASHLFEGASAEIQKGVIHLLRAASSQSAPKKKAGGGRGSAPAAT